MTRTRSETELLDLALSPIEFLTIEDIYRLLLDPEDGPLVSWRDSRPVTPMPEATAKIAVAIKHDIDAGSFTGFSWEMITARNVSSIWDWDTHAYRWFHYNPIDGYFDPEEDDESQLDSSIVVSADGHMLTHGEILQFAHDGLLKYDA